MRTLTDAWKVIDCETMQGSTVDMALCDLRRRLDEQEQELCTLRCAVEHQQAALEEMAVLIVRREVA